MRATANHFQPSQQLSNNEDNQFLLAPSRITDSSKDQVIKKLQLKNQRLMTEIQKIQKVLNEDCQKTVYGNKLPQVSQKVTQQELQNAYKQIKSYEYEIKKLRSTNKDGSYVEQIKKCEALLKQKQQMSEKLRKQLHQIKKQSMQLTKFLKNDNKKQQIQAKTVKLNGEVKFLREKIRQIQLKGSMNNQNRQKQLAFIKKLQNQLVESGYPLNSIRNLRQKYSPKANPNQSYYSNGRSTALKNQNSKPATTQQQQKQQVIQDRTPQAFKSLQNEIKLIQKMQKDYMNQLSVYQKQKQQAANNNMKSRNKLIQVQDQIQRVQTRINQLKRSIDPAKIRPVKGMSMQNVGRYGDVNRSLTSLKESFKHLFKNEQVGKLSLKGRRFADRIKLVKNQAKIVALDLYQKKQGNNLVGLQATYDINKNLKKGPLNMICDQKETVKKSLTLFDNTDYLKSIELICNQKGIIIGIAVMSRKEVTARAGLQEGFRRPLNIARNQYPACLYGSFVQQGIELFGTEILQQKQEK